MRGGCWRTDGSRSWEESDIYSLLGYRQCNNSCVRPTRDGGPEGTRKGDEGRTQDPKTTPTEGPTDNQGHETSAAATLAEDLMEARAQARHFRHLADAKAAGA